MQKQEAVARWPEEKNPYVFPGYNIPVKHTFITDFLSKEFKIFHANSLAYDYHYSDRLLLGGGLGYAFNYVHYSQGIGHGKVHEELLCLYTAYQQKHFRWDAILWTGLYQFHNTRHTLDLMTSTAKTNGYLLTPHIEFAFPYSIQRGTYCFEPFVSCDWVNSWQKHFTEKGASGFNLVMDGFYTALVQSEAGLRTYEEWNTCRGTWLLEEKISYINQAPIHANKMNTAFIESASIFPIAVASQAIQNLVGLELSAAYQPNNHDYPSIGLDFQAMIGSAYQSYFGTIYIRKVF